MLLTVKGHYYQTKLGSLAMCSKANSLTLSAGEGKYSICFQGTKQGLWAGSL